MEWIFPGRTVVDMRKAMNTREMHRLKKSLAGTDPQVSQDFIDLLKVNRSKTGMKRCPSTAGAGSIFLRPAKTPKK